MESRISATETGRRFSDIVNRVFYRGEEFVVERGGEDVCKIVPAGPRRFTLNELAALLSATPKPDPAFWDDVETAATEQPNVPESTW